MWRCMLWWFLVSQSTAISRSQATWRCFVRAKVVKPSSANASGAADVLEALFSDLEKWWKELFDREDQPFSKLFDSLVVCPSCDASQNLIKPTNPNAIEQSLHTLFALFSRSELSAHLHSATPQSNTPPNTATQHTTDPPHPSTLHTPLSTLHTLQSPHSRLHTSLSTLHTPHPTLHTPLHTPLSTLHTPGSTHHTPHTTLHTPGPHSTHQTPHHTLHTHPDTQFPTAGSVILLEIWPPEKESKRTLRPCMRKHFRNCSSPLRHCANVSALLRQLVRVCESRFKKDISSTCNYGMVCLRHVQVNFNQMIVNKKGTNMWLVNGQCSCISAI